MRGRRALAVTVVSAALVAATALAFGLGIRESMSSSTAGAPTVYAASSLTEALAEIDPAARFSFGSSRTLALQIRRGAPADVFASADPALADDLHAAGVVERPQTLALNRLAVIVPRSNPGRLTTVADLDRHGLALVVAADGVPVGDYTRVALRRLGLSGALRNVVSREADARDVVGKVALGQADAGVVYVTDARAAGAAVTAIAIPDAAQPRVRYAIAVVREGPNPGTARAFVRRAVGPEGRRALARAGFLLPPARP